MVKSKNENFEVLCISAKLSVAHTQSYLLHCLNIPLSKQILKPMSSSH